MLNILKTTKSFVFKITKKINKYILLMFFILGLLMTFAGWHLDNISNFPALLKIIDSDYLYGNSVLNGLLTDNKIAVTSNHPGFHVLLKYWPELSDKQSVFCIGRSLSYLQLGPEIKGDMELIAYDSDYNKLSPRWKESSARELFINNFKKRIFVLKYSIFYIGLLITFVSGLTGILNRKKK